ncbi:MAG: hypothetical protein CBE20_00380 [Gammaproteobacteria bacterium TMED260]|nr:hypothetical protein [Gammaproteobacteria bacterium]OUX35075.1 MAG: hypothetical protein CBE20_00380 [Gammaproteobacteria bacterium TMED260]|tara:strand:- start:385 stop:672 length:288 start_codon:yes stop_codon:yes gene_type:complete
MAKVSRLGAVSLARLLALLMASLGFLAGVLYSVGGFLFELSTGTLNSGTALAFLALLGLPLLFGLIGCAAGLILAPLYNFLARFGYGLELELDTE